ncbi:MAG: galactonate dehydratase [Acidobacteriota bacterium]|nr:galactonate dehydratase [Acidobacteriota bacterium]
MKRREFLNTGAGLPLMAQAMPQGTTQNGPQYTGKPALRIADIQSFLVGVGGRNLCFVKVLTDQGITGWGEAYSVGPDEATVATIRDFKGWLVGKDPRNVEYLWATMYNFTRFPGGAVINAAISGIEHALWDISGKAAGLPVYMLLGGKCRDKIRLYQSAGGSTPQQLAASAKQLIAKYGYTAIKMAPHPPRSQSMPWNAVTRAVAQRSEAVRDAVGPDIDLAYDAHATVFEPIRAYQMAEALKPSRPFWIEEPIRMENVDALQTLKRKIEIPLATGECLYTKFDFREILSKQAADIVQPDICLAGGVMELKKIAGMADAHYVVVAPHNPMGPLATMVNVHFAASTPNFLILEYHPDDESPRKDLIKDPSLVKDGYLAIPDKPGWGYEVNEEAFRHYPAKPWHRGFAFGPDGAPDYI